MFHLLLLVENKQKLTGNLLNFMCVHWCTKHDKLSEYSLVVVYKSILNLVAVPTKLRRHEAEYESDRCNNIPGFNICLVISSFLLLE